MKKEKQYVVIPYGEYFRMRLAMLEYDDDDENDWEDIPYESDIYDNVGLPGEVCDIMHNENVSLQAAAHFTRHVPAGGGGEAWHQPVRRVTAGSAGLPTAKAHPRKLAALYGCKQEQISLYLPKEG